MLVSAALRKAIKDSGLSAKKLAKLAGVSRSTLSRFMSDDPEMHRDIRLEITVDGLAKFLELELVPSAQQVSRLTGNGGSTQKPSTRRSPTKKKA